MADLAASGAHAVLIGTGHHVRASKLAELPSVDTTLDDLRRTLEEVCGLPPERVTRVAPESSPEDIIAAVEEVVARAVGPVLLCYVGHGVLGPGDELYLATRFSLSAQKIAQTVSYRTLRDVLGEPGHDCLVLLDCCFSGRATNPPTRGGERQPFSSALPRGSFLLSSASHYAVSFAPEGEQHTLFSGRLLRLMNEGDAGGPPWWTGDGLHAALDHEFADDIRVNPSKRSEGVLGGLPLARNRAYRGSGPAEDAEVPADITCPYPGLKPFGADGREFFFGREELTERLLDSVARTGDSPVFAVGASGAGKSSLLRAGLLATLESRRAAGDQDVHWPALLLPAPGAHPVRALAELWARATGREPVDVQAALEEGRLLTPLRGHQECRLLVVDQFEEVFTRCEDPAERTAFIAALTRDNGRPFKVVLGLRADNYGDCLEHPALERALAEAQLTVPPMREQELRAAIEKPADRVGLVLDKGVTDRLLHDLREGRAGEGETAALPFLAHVLRETWVRRSGVRLTLAGYDGTGGIWRSVTKTGDDLHRSLDADGQALLRELLLRMVHVPPDSVGVRAGVRHRIPFDDLMHGLPPRAVDIRRRLAEARLIAVDQDTAQIAHEALLRAWSKLGDWIEEDAALLRLRQQVRLAADEWYAAARDQAFLYRGSKLEAALELRDASGGRRGLPARTREFLAAGETEADRARRDRRRRIRILKTAVVGLLVGLLVSVGSTFVAVRQRQQAQEQRDRTTEQRQLAGYRALIAQAANVRATDPRTSLDLGLAAYALRPSGEARHVLFETLATSPFRGGDVLPEISVPALLSPDARVLATHTQKDLTLWDVSRIPARAVAHLPCPETSRGLSTSMAFGQDGRKFASVCQDGSVSLWNLDGLRTGREPHRLAALRAEELPGTPKGVALSADGTRLAAVGWWSQDAVSARKHGGNLVLWDVTEGRHARRTSVTPGAFETDSVVYAPDGRTLVATADSVKLRVGDPVGHPSNLYASNGTRVWDVSDPAAPRPGGFVEGSNGLAAISPDGHVLATADGLAARLTDISSPTRPTTLAAWPAHTGDVQGLAFSPDGQRLATGSADRTVNVWEVSSPKSPKRMAQLSGHGTSHGKKRIPKADIGTVAFDPSGRSLVSVDSPFTSPTEIIRWDTSDRVEPRVVKRIPGDEMAWIPHSTVLAAGEGSGIGMWDMTDPAAPRRVATPQKTDTGGADIVDLAVSADGTLLASADFDGVVHLWNVADRRAPRLVGRLVTENATFTSVALSPDASALAVLGSTLHVWDVSNPSAPKKISSVPGVEDAGDISFSPNGRRLLIPKGPETDRFGPRVGVSLWDLGAGEKGIMPLGNGTPVIGTAHSTFGPDGGLAASDESSVLGTSVLLWNVKGSRKPVEVGRITPEDGHEIAVRDLSFHPWGTLLAGGGDDGTAWLWSVADPAQPHLAGALDGFPGPVTDTVFSLDGRTLLASSKQTIYVWDLGDYPTIAKDTLGMACRLTGGGLNRYEWPEAVASGSDIPFRTSCPTTRTGVPTTGAARPQRYY